MSGVSLGDFEGELIRPRDAEYDGARRLWNGAIDRRPELIARCANADDAGRALSYALDRGLPVAIRGGGHNVSGSALCDGGVVIDFSLLRQVGVDPIRRVARVQPGALWGDVDAATQRHGLATPAGIVTHTGVAGLTVGGGFGWLSRRWGLTSDNVLAYTVLLADGATVRTTADDQSDLFWAVSGGGGNFGVVTAFEFRLHDLGTEVLAGPLIYPASRARDVLRYYAEFIAEAPNELAVFVNLRSAPALEWIPSHLRGTDVVMLIPFWSGDLAEGENILAPLRRVTHPAADLVQRKRYLAQQSMFDAGVPHGWNYYWKSHYLPPLTDGAIDVLIDRSWRKASPASYTLLFHLGGAISGRPTDASAASGRDASHAININAAWDGGAPGHPDIEWCRSYFAAMASYATGGVYVNFLHNDEGEARTRAAYGDRYDRLVRIKARFDRANIFRSNQNIPPT
jgi:FAD/FMN-containing dehydrogenase